MLSWLLGTAYAAGTTPDDRVEVWADTGVMTSQVGLAFGFGAGMRKKGYSLIGTAGVGGRGNLFQAGVSQRPGFGLGTLAAAIDLDKTGTVALAIIADAALLDNIEHDCGSPVHGRDSCRHYLFLGSDGGPKMGVSFQPAGGVKLMGHGTSGAGYAVTLGAQPHWLYENHYWFAPRVDISIGLTGWSAHAWGGRYGVALGIGHSLSRRDGVQQ